MPTCARSSAGHLRLPGRLAGQRVAAGALSQQLKKQQQLKEQQGSLSAGRPRDPASWDLQTLEWHLGLKGAALTRRCWTCGSCAWLPSWPCWQGPASGGDVKELYSMQLSVQLASACFSPVGWYEYTGLRDDWGRCICMLHCTPRARA